MTERVFKALYEKNEWHDGTGSVWSDKFSRETPYHFEDGVSISVTPTDLSPSDKFLTERTA